MKFDNWAEYVLLSGSNEFLGQGSSGSAAVRDAMNRGVSPARINAGMIHTTCLKPQVDVEIRLRTARGMLREIGK